MSRLAAWCAAVMLLAACEDEPAPAALCGGHRDVEPGPPPVRVERTAKRYATPDVVLVDQDGTEVKLADALRPGEAVALNFVFTTCTTICPVMSAAFSGLRQRDGVRLVSISIDPEHDRPEVLKAYAARYGRAASWRFLTGSAEDIRAVLAAFEASAGGKTNHRPFTLVRRAASDEWVRLEGLPTTQALLAELEPGAQRVAR